MDGVLDLVKSATTVYITLLHYMGGTYIQWKGFFKMINVAYCGKMFVYASVSVRLILPKAREAVAAYKTGL